LLILYCGIQIAQSRRFECRSTYPKFILTTSKTLILGVGNLILSDEGIGVRVIQRLEQLYELPEEVEILDGGTLGLNLLYHLQGVGRLLLIDAVETGNAPGSLIRLEGEAVPEFLSVKMSPHQIGISDMLFAAKLVDLHPDEVVLLGVQPAVIETGLELSPAVGAQLQPLVGQVLAQLEQWGVGARRRPDLPEDA
jgi:hydrogenase maturation protease